jgi:hypothetical protein
MARGDARPTGQKFANEFFRTFAPDASDENENSRFARRHFLKRRGFFFQRETNKHL